MKKSPELFRMLIMVLHANPNFVEASRALQLSERIPFIWLQQSKAAAAAGEEDSEFLFKLDPDDADEAPAWLHEHAKTAITVSIEQIESAARARARDGTWVPAKWQGRDVWQLEDPALVELLGLPDEFRRDARGNRIREMVWLPPATDLVLGVLAAHARRYRKLAGGGTVVNVNNSQTNGVLVIPQPKPQIAAPLPTLEVVPDEAQAIAEMLGEDMPDDEAELRPEAVEIVDRVLGVPYPPREPSAPVPDPVVIKTPTPPEYAPAANPLIRPRAALSEAERALLSRLPSSNNRKG